MRIMAVIEVLKTSIYHNAEVLTQDFELFQGRFESNDIHNNKLAGVWIKNYASPLFRGNNIHHGRDVGFFIFQDGQVCLCVSEVRGEGERRSGEE